ncbi:ImmA/IrrE family metallo-endopeptidase [Devosia psychrophila]|nr:ImmA/IrrE family metallo-endopeptidase [Devosia psychrophila]
MTSLELARHLDIPLTKLSELSDLDAGAVSLLSNAGSAAFSATALCDGSYRHIVFNDLVHSNRVNSSIMHEIAHVVLGHPPMPPLTEHGHRNVDKTLEQEADHLAFTLLVPKRAALHAFENFGSLSDAARHYGVSNSLLTLRYRLCDVARWSTNRRRKLSQPIQQ